MTILNELWKAVLVAGGIGAAGGLALDLLQEKGLQLPSIDRGTPNPTATDLTPEALEMAKHGLAYLDLGFIAPIAIGAFAAVVSYATNQPDTGVKLIGAALIAGLGGSGILKSYIKDKAATQATDQAQASQAAAKDAVGVQPNSEEAKRMTTQIDTLMSATQATKRRYGIR